MAAAVAGVISTPQNAVALAGGGVAVGKTKGLYYSQSVVPQQQRRSSFQAGVCVARLRKTVEERFKIQHEKNVSEERVKELGVSRWSKWECGPKVTYRHEWQVDEQIYIAKGSIMVTPEDCEDSAYFYQGDIVRFPKWLVADLTFDDDYEQFYRFLAYGD